MKFLPNIPILLKDITLDENASIVNAMKLMAENDVGCIIVVNGKGEVCGILSERDIIKILGIKDFIEDLKVKNIMSKNVYCMKERKYHSWGSTRNVGGKNEAFTNN